MNILWFSHFIPYPPQGGNRQRSFNLLREVASQHEVGLVALNLEGEGPARVRESRDRLEQLFARVEIWEVPVPWRGARWWLRAVRSPFLPLPYSCQALWSAELDGRWRRLLGEFQADVVHLDSPDLVRFGESIPEVPCLLNHHNCESWMATRRAVLERHPLRRIFLSAQAAKWRQLEASYCARYRVNVVVSARDGKLLQESCSDAHVHVVENGVDMDFFRPAGFGEPGTLVFAGSLDWYPNISGLRYFMKEVWPLIAASRDAVRLILAGRNPSDEMRGWARRDRRVEVVGSPPDIRPYLQRGAVFVCPLLDGGGTRLKILDAMAAGKAVVTTTIGCEGLRVSPDENILIGDTPEDFARQVLRLLDEPRLAERLAARARRLVESTYSWQIIAQRLEAAYRCARAACPLDPPPAGGGPPSP